MNDIPTPRTDALEINDPMCDPAKVVTSDFARQLEREIAVMELQRNELLEALERMVSAFNKTGKKLYSLSGEPTAMDCATAAITKAKEGK